MQSFTLIIDAPFDASHANGPASTLLMPLGYGSVCQRIAQSLPLSRMEEILVLAAPGVETPDYAAQVRDAIDHDHVRMIRANELAAFLASCEPEDEMFAVDTRRFPECGFADVLSMIGRNGYRGADHAVSIGTDRRARERVDCDAAGRIRKVSRLYAGVDLPATANHAAVLSIMSPRAILPASPASLPEFRAAVIAGGHFTRDVPVATAIIDLSTPAGLLWANKRLLLSAQAPANPAVPGYSLRGEKVWIAADSNVDDGARLIGPAIVHCGARIAGDATVVGPAVIGAGAVVGAGAKVVQSVCTPQSRVGKNQCVRNTTVIDVSSGGDRVNEPAQSWFWPKATDWEQDTLSIVDAAPAQTESNDDRSVQLAVKRAIDILLSLFGLIVLSPLLVIVALLVRLESRGPIWFIHHREHKDGASFPCYKFRTMVADAHRMQRKLSQANEVDGPQFKMTVDPRITRIGRWLRATNIDELPQLFNVLMGHMSLVGPRPSPFRENQICVPWRKARLSVRPGITGLWQVCRSSDRSHGDFHEWIFYDMLYVERFSLWLDIKIVVATILTLGGRWSTPVSVLVPTGRRWAT